MVLGSDTTVLTSTMLATRILTSLRLLTTSLSTNTSTIVTALVTKELLDTSEVTSTQSVATAIVDIIQEIKLSFFFFLILLAILGLVIAALLRAILAFIVGEHGRNLFDGTDSSGAGLGVAFILLSIFLH